MRKLPAIDQISAFLAVAEELSFRSAAERLALDQSALSRRIKELEARIGYRLLSRTTHAVRLTDAGRHFYEANRTLLACLGKAIDDGARVAQGATGALRVAYMTFAAVHAMPAAVARYRAEFPNVAVLLSYQRTQQQKLSLAQGEIDVALMLGPFEHSDFETLEIAREHLVALMAADHALARKQTLAIADLAAVPIVLGTDEQWDYYRAVVLDILSAKGITPSIAMEAPSLFGILGLVGAGVGITLAPDIMAGFCPPGIVARPIGDVDRTITTVAAWRRPADRKVLDFVACLKRGRAAASRSR